jgi:hypothetical protein
LHLLYIMPIDYSFLSASPACPTCPTGPAGSASFANPAPLYENLVFWTLGYGGWTGIALLPIVWSLSVSRSMKAVLSVLLIPTTALVVTASFGGFYLFANFVHAIASVMISSAFIHSCLAIVCVGVGSVGMFLAGSKRLEIQMVVETVETTNSDAGSETGDDVGSDEESDESDESHTSADDDGSTEESTEEDASSEDSTDSTDNTWRETANVEGLREAAPLPE